MTDFSLAFFGLFLLWSDGQLPVCASWMGLLEEGLKRCSTDQKWRDDHLEKLRNGSTTEVAQAVRDTLEGKKGSYVRETPEKRVSFSKFLEEATKEMKCHNDSSLLLVALQRARLRGAKFATTNYDDILENVLGQSAVHRSDEDALRDWVEKGKGVFHIHGHFSRPGDVVLGCKDYDAFLKSRATQYALDSLSNKVDSLSNKVVIFIGAEPTVWDPNISKLISRIASVSPMFVLARQSEMGAFNQKGVTTVSYGTDFAHFVPFLLFLFSPNDSILKPPETVRRGPFMIKTSTRHQEQDMYLCSKKTDTQYREIFLRPSRDLGDTFHRFWVAEFDAAHLMVYLETSDGLLALSPGLVVAAVGQYHQRHRLCAVQFGIMHFNLIATCDQWVDGGSSSAGFLWSWREGMDRFFLKPIHVGCPDPGNQSRTLHEVSTVKTQSVSEGLRFSLCQVL